ncbi:MAG TPA: hypothetical protein VHL08_04595 [Dongiaceae bacterium]|jgi:hypothetical protein|nr:hypothetical protein [Dongiaceae bacterium]
MSLQNYADLIGAVPNWLARVNDAELTAIVPDLVALAEKRIYYGAGGAVSSPPLRLREMEQSLTLPLSGQSTTLPSDYLALRRIHLGNNIGETVYLSPQNFWPCVSARLAGRSRFYTIEGTQLQITPVPGTGDTAMLDYFALPASLGAVGTNAVFATYPHLYLYATLLEAAIYCGDDQGLQKWHGLYFGAAAGITAQDEAARNNATPLAMRTA